MEVVSLGLVVLVVVFFGLGVKIVPQSQNFVVERLGRFNRTLEAGPDPDNYESNMELFDMRKAKSPIFKILDHKRPIY